jgi:hypothetical protein
MSIEKEQLKMFGHLHPEKIMKTHEKKIISQHDRPSDSRNRKIVSIGKQDR